jgi:myo-inositol-1-phosphate synthase
MAAKGEGRRRGRPAGIGPSKVGLWMIGACGGVGSTVALGVAALAKKLAATSGLVSELPVFGSAGLIDPKSIVIGGHEIRSQSVLDAVRASQARAGLFNTDLIGACAPQLRAIQRDIRPGALYGAGSNIRKLADRPGLDRDRSPADVIERIGADLTAFRRRHRLEHVVVVHVASSEPLAPRAAVHADFAKLSRALTRRGSRVLPTSSLYALAAIEAGCPFINFTPSLGICVPAIRRRADALSLPYMGSDGKTGESLVKSVLAPMFAMRNLPVLSWVGQNVLGNRDGAVLSDPKTRASKIRSKDKVVSQILGRAPTTCVSIDYLPSLDDWKVAWDFIHFQGFLGTKMNMQFVWQGSDSILAAPLIIDLVRFTVRECRAGRGGPMRHLACFFKDPIDVKEQNYFKQWQLLLEHMAESQKLPPPKPTTGTHS